MSSITPEIPGRTKTARLSMCWFVDGAGEVSVAVGSAAEGRSGRCLAELGEVELFAGAHPTLPRSNTQHMDGSRSTRPDDNHQARCQTVLMSSLVG